MRRSTLSTAKTSSVPLNPCAKGQRAVDYTRIALWNILPNGRKTAFYSIGGMLEKHPSWFREDLTALFDLLAAGKLKPAIERHMRLEDAAVKGRIVLTVSEQIK